MKMAPLRRSQNVLADTHAVLSLVTQAMIAAASARTIKIVESGSNLPGRHVATIP
jgi:hypothetical protein